MIVDKVDSLKKIITFDFFNLFDSEEFNSWLTVNEIKIETYRFGNLKKYENRNKFYQELSLKLKIDFDEKSKNNSKNLLRVLKNYCLKYLDEEYSEIEFCGALSFFRGNCQDDFFDNIDLGVSKIFWYLFEFTEMNRQELGDWKVQILRGCKNLIKEIDN